MLQKQHDILEYHRERISMLDPLGGDALLSRLPQMNAAADLPALANGVRILLPTVQQVDEYSFEESLAAMRDIGLFLGSIKRHGMQPLTLVPELEPVLLELGWRTDMIPRDTVHHYTEWNPLGQRQRMYTGEAQEEWLMNGARLALPHLGQAVELCKILSRLSLTEPSFPTTLEALAEQVGFFDLAITDVVAKVTPEFFAQVMRPYYEDIVVGGINYLGPAAAHLPLFLVDLVVWASDHGDPIYSAFLREAAQHTLPHWRALAHQWEEQPSLIARLNAEVEAIRSDRMPPALQQGAEALSKILRRLIAFRGKHFGIARQAYRDELRLYELGSGGGSIGLLRTILDLTLENARMVRKASSIDKAGA